MTNREISDVFRAIGTLLQIRGDDAFRARIYERAADIIEEFPRELTSETSEEDVPSYNKEALQQLRATPGIGKAIEDKTVEMLETGRCKYYDDLTAEMGTEILELLAIRGVGVKTVGRFYQEFGVKNLEDLRVLIESGRIQNMKGIGQKTLQMITEGLAFQAKQRTKRLFWNILPTAQDILNHLAQLADDGWINRYQFTGDLRRYEEVCQSIELIVECVDETAFRFENNTLPPALQSILTHLSQARFSPPGLQQTSDDPSSLVLFKARDQISYLYDSELATLVEKERSEPTDDVRHTLPVIQFCVDKDFPVSVYLCTAASYDATLFLTTATDAHFDAFPDSDFLKLPNFWHEARNLTEAGIYEKLKCAYVPSELRQDEASVTAAKEGTLPVLIEFTNLRGDLHAHTDWSDGRHTLREMIEAAMAQDFEYLAITDHSVSSTVANGLDRQRLLAQVAKVRELDAEISGIKVFAGSEVDIRRYGELDFPDEILAQLDIVVASVHSHFTLTEAEMTQRIVRAIENPLVNIIGHPTGRMLGRRPMYPLNLEEIIEAAAENNTVLEINGSPHRLDLAPKFVRMAKSTGVLLSVNTDAHGIEQLAHRQSGLNVARRGWLTKAEVINTYSVEELRERCGIGEHS